MELGLHCLRDCPWDADCDDLIYSSFLDLGQRLEVLHQLLLAFWSQTFDAVQLGGEGILRTKLAVEGDGETVDFILDPLQEEKFLRGPREFDDLERIAEEQFMGLVLVILLQACDRNIQPQLFLAHLLSDIDLALSPIDDDQIWWRQAIPHDTAVSSANDLPHAGIVIWPNDGLDLVLAVVLFAWLPIDKDHHG